MQTVYMVCGGPSLRTFDFDRLRGLRHVAINRAWETCPEAEAVFFLDQHFEDRALGIDGKTHPGGRLLSEFRGRKVRCLGYNQPVIPPVRPGIEYWTCKPGPRISPQACLYWIDQTMPEVSRVVLLGCDHKPGPNGESHCHTGYDRKPVDAAGYASFDSAMQDAAHWTKRLLILNANPDSALTCFPKVTLEEALADVYLVR